MPSCTRSSMVRAVDALHRRGVEIVPGDDVIADRKLADAVTQAIVDHIEVLRGRRQGVEAEVQIPYEPADRLATQPGWICLGRRGA